MLPKVGDTFTITHVETENHWAGEIVVISIDVTDSKGNEFTIQPDGDPYQDGNFFTIYES